MHPAVSVIIPARNDAEALRLTLDHLERLPRIQDAEIIVAASGDRSDRKSRRVQGQNSMACAVHARSVDEFRRVPSSGRSLFLFARRFISASGRDNRNPRGFGDEKVVGGAFQHCFEEDVWSLKFISWINRRRYFFTRNYYGDQGIFMRADIFRRLGGYRDVFMEDLDLTRRLKRLGRTRVIPLPLITSGRRFLAGGPGAPFGLLSGCSCCIPCGLTQSGMLRTGMPKAAEPQISAACEN